ncbi:MAG TPA: hypothetical protein DCR81_05235 [Smithella sp.]|jgi:IS5 family transposase|nr:hypothetical protein [Smithella sp.]
MRPKDNSFEESHGDLFRSDLEQAQTEDILCLCWPIRSSGYKRFQHALPIDPSSMTRWRKRLGPDKIESSLLVAIDTAKEKNLLTERHVERVNVDTTVQEKAIAFPTDARLYHKVRRVLVKAAKKMDINLRRSYEQTGQKVFLKQGRYASAGQHNRAKKETKRLKTMLGCVIRDINASVPTRKGV